MLKNLRLKGCGVCARLLWVRVRARARRGKESGGVKNVLVFLCVAWRPSCCPQRARRTVLVFPVMAVVVCVLF